MKAMRNLLCGIAAALLLGGAAAAQDGQYDTKNMNIEQLNALSQLPDLKKQLAAVQKDLADPAACAQYKAYPTAFAECAARIKPNDKMLIAEIQGLIGQAEHQLKTGKTSMQEQEETAKANDAEFSSLDRLNERYAMLAKADAVKYCRGFAFPAPCRPNDYERKCGLAFTDETLIAACLTEARQKAKEDKQKASGAGK